MTLEFITQAKKVLFTSWASRLGAAAALLQALAEFQEQLPIIRDYVPHNVFSLLAVLCAISVPLARVVKQQALVEAAAEAPPAIDPNAPLTAHTAPPPPVLARS